MGKDSFSGFLLLRRLRNGCWTRELWFSVLDDDGLVTDPMMPSELILSQTWTEVFGVGNQCPESGWLANYLLGQGLTKCSALVVSKWLVRQTFDPELQCSALVVSKWLVRQTFDPELQCSATVVSKWLVRQNFDPELQVYSIPADCLLLSNYLVPTNDYFNQSIITSIIIIAG